MKINEAVSKKLNLLLDKHKWSTYKLAKESGLTATAIQNLVYGKYTDVKLSTLILIANAFGLHVAEFLNGSLFDYSNLDIDK